MTNINVTYESMDSVAAKLLAGQEELEAKLIELKMLVTDLTTNGFTTSKASGVFNAAYEEFTAGATQTVSGLEGMSRFLTNAAQTLHSADEQLASSIQF